MRPARAVWRQDTAKAAPPPTAKLSRGGLRPVLESIVIDHPTVARVAAGLGVSWHTANNAVLSAVTGPVLGRGRLTGTYER